MNWVDLVVSLLAIFEVALTLMINLPVAPVIFRLMRIGRLVRAVRMVTMTSSMGSLQLLVKCLASSRDARHRPSLLDLKHVQNECDHM